MKMMITEIISAKKHANLYKIKLKKGENGYVCQSACYYYADCYDKDEHCQFVIH